VDNDFNFLDSAQAELLKGILARRNSVLFARVQRTPLMSRSDADEIVTTISDELTDNLDEEWEPTEYGRTVNEVLAKFNTARIGEWPA